MKNRIENIPSELYTRPIDHRGFPVPWFVTRKDQNGNWDFVNIDPERFEEAFHRNVCWVSGKPLGAFKSFVVGPMCVINRVSGDPPVKLSMAHFSVLHCPFLSNPKAKRPGAKDDIEPEQRGLMVNRNPGISAIYTTKSYTRIPSGILMLGEPTSVEWWKEGRKATYEEAKSALLYGHGVLQEMAKDEGKEAEKELERYMEEAMVLLPKTDG